MSRRRKGITLVEILVAISISSTVISMTGVCIHGLYRAQQATQKAIDSQASVARLAHQIRVDCRAATVANIGDAGSSLSLKLGKGQQIQYTFAVDRVTRQRLIDDEVLHRDAFLTASGVTVVWEIDTTDEVTFVRTVLAHLTKRGKEDDLAFEQEILATIGRRLKTTDINSNPRDARDRND